MGDVAGRDVGHSLLARLTLEATDMVPPNQSPFSKAKLWRRRSDHDGLGSTLRRICLSGHVLAGNGAVEGGLVCSGGVLVFLVFLVLGRSNGGQPRGREVRPVSCPVQGPPLLPSGLEIVLTLAKIASCVEIILLVGLLGQPGFYKPRIDHGLQRPPSAAPPTGDHRRHRGDSLAGLHCCVRVQIQRGLRMRQPRGSVPRKKSPPPAVHVASASVMR